jgi:hypothetical protein
LQELREVFVLKMRSTAPLRRKGRTRRANDGIREMKSDELPDSSNWHSWNSEMIAQAPDRPGAYVIRLSGKSFGRLQGESDVVYIGCAPDGAIRNRLKNHLRPNSSNRLRDVQRVGSLQAWKELKSADEANDEEAKLLRVAGARVFRQGSIQISRKTRRIPFP